MSKNLRTPQDEKLFKAIVRLNTQVIGLTLGTLTALTIFVATNWLVLKGGHIEPGGEHVVGPNLQLLSQFFLGYRVSFVGSIIGAAYGFALGTLAGSLMGWIYNKVVDLRN